jgi:hypothetical protein
LTFEFDWPNYDRRWNRGGETILRRIVFGYSYPRGRKCFRLDRGTLCFSRCNGSRPFFQERENKTERDGGNKKEGLDHSKKASSSG